MTLSQYTPSKDKLVILILALILTLLLFIPIAPSMVDQGRDSGIYAYTAKVIVEDGGLPYRDAWDNKPPGIYYIDAVAFYLFGVNRWSVWLIEWAFILVATLALVWIVDTLYRKTWLSILSLLLFILLARHRALVGHGNLTESYALLPQMLCLAFGLQFLRQPSSKWGILLGFSASVAFLIKQSTIGVALSFIPAILISNHPVWRSSRRWHWLGSMIAGGLAGLGATALYLWANGILDDAIDASFIGASDFHNWVSRESVPMWETLPSTLTSGTFQDVFLPYMPFVIIAVLITLGHRFAKLQTPSPSSDVNPRLSKQDYTTFLIWIALMFCADIAILNPTNRAYSHYYITLVPSVVIMIIVCLNWLVSWRKFDNLPVQRLANIPLQRWVISGVALYLFIWYGSGAFMHISKFNQREGDLFGPEVVEKTAEFIEENTDPDDTVFVWGASTDLNFQSDRESPTVFHYAYPLIVPGYTEEEDLETLLEDLEENEPAMIVDSAVSDGDRVPPLGVYDRAEWVAEGGRTDTFDLEPLFEFVADHCQRLGIYDDEAAIYVCHYDDSTDRT